MESGTAADEQAKAVAPEEPKKKSSCCAKCCKCYCCCCCSCLLLLVIAGIVVFNTVLKVDAQNPPAPAAPTSDVTLGVSYSGSDPNGDAAFKSSLVSSVLGALPGNSSDVDGEIADSLVFSPSRRLGSADASRELASSSWTVVMALKGEAAMSAADVFTSSSFNPSSIANVLSLSVSSDMSVLAMGHLLKDLNFVCKGAIAKIIDEYRGEIIEGLEKENVTDATLGISEDGWVWAAFRKSGWKYSATALGCELTLVWEEAIKGVLEQDLGSCTLSGEGVKAVVSSGKGGDACYIDSIKNLLSETELEQCPAAGDSMCSSWPQSGVCEDFEYPGCSSCPTPASMKYLPCTPFE